MASMGKAANGRHRRHHQLLGKAATVAIALSLLLGPAAIAAAPGDTVVNPVSNQEETVVQDLGGGKVLTDHDNVIIIDPPALGDSYVEDGVTYTVVALTVNADSGLVEEVTFSDGAETPTIRYVSTVQDVSAEMGGGPPPEDAPQPGDPGGPVVIPVPPGNVNVVPAIERGGNGDSGDNAYGNIDAYQGGAAGAGGTVSVTSSVGIATSE